MEKYEFEGEVDRVWDVGSKDIIGYYDIGGIYHCLHFGKNVLLSRFPRKSKVKVTIEQIKENP